VKEKKIDMELLWVSAGLAGFADTARPETRTDAEV
jgi:hypothetical protein